jgi:hypothetical protein
LRRQRVNTPRVLFFRHNCRQDARSFPWENLCLQYTNFRAKRQGGDKILQFRDFIAVFSVGVQTLLTNIALPDIISDTAKAQKPKLNL